MSHEVTHNSFGDAFIERKSRQRAWHGLGTVFDIERCIGLVEAGEQIGALSEFETSPAFALVDGQYIPTGFHNVIRKSSKASPFRVIAPCSEDWKPINPRWICEAFEPVARHYRLETMGDLRNGEIFFFTLRGDNYGVRSNGKDDEHESYIYSVDYHVPGSAYTMGAGSTRIVCMNTLMTALGASQFKLPIPHTSNVQLIISEISKALAKLGSAQTALKEAYQMLADFPMTDKQVDEVYGKVWGSPRKPKLLVALDTLHNPETTETQQEIVWDPTMKADDLKDVKDAMSSSPELQKLADQQERAHVARTAQMNTLQTYGKISLAQMVDEGYGQNAYTVLQSIMETAEHRAANKRGNVQQDMFDGGRSGQAWKAGQVLMELVTKN